MNNYPDFINYNFSNMYENPLYNPYNGFIRGNLFKDLYIPYKKNEPYEVKPINEQASMLTDIDALCFALIDLNLYLDVNPDDNEIINLYNNYKNKKDTLIKEYENKYGPITLDSNSLNSFPWAWNNMPWPWDN